MLASIVKQLTPILQAKRSAELANAVFDVCTEYVDIEKAWFLELSFDGRHLAVAASYNTSAEQHLCGNELLPVFLCDKFDQPFSHVAFNGKGLLLDNLQHNTELKNAEYQQWIGSSNHELLIEPVYVNEKFFGLWALQGTHLSRDFTENDDIQALLDIAALQLTDLASQHTEKNNRINLVSHLNALNTDIKKQDQKKQLADSIIGQSDAVMQLQDKIITAARSKLSVLIHGETGVGKELVAKAIHQQSDRSKESFIALNCAAIPESLLESELFGFVKGAFSGASVESKGLLGQADKGVFFLDEIGDMPLSIQAKMLRVLETKQYRQLGGTQERRCDFRLIAATHRPFTELIEKELFRSDLYYRLNSFPIVVAPLRKRRDDIPLLCEHFIHQFNLENNSAIIGITPSVTEKLQQFPFNGNIRELKNIIDLACVNNMESQVIKDIDLSTVAMEKHSEKVAPVRDSISSEYDALPSLDDIHSLKDAMAQFEEKIISRRLLKFKGNKTKAAETLGLPRRTFTNICQRLELRNNEE